MGFLGTSTPPPRVPGWTTIHPLILQIKSTPWGPDQDHVQAPRAHKHTSTQTYKHRTMVVRYDPDQNTKGPEPALSCYARPKQIKPTVKPPSSPKNLPAMWPKHICQFQQDIGKILPMCGDKPLSNKAHTKQERLRQRRNGNFRPRSHSSMGPLCDPKPPNHTASWNTHKHTL